MEKMEFKSKDIVSDNVEKISNLFPNVVSEGKIDFEKLRQELSNDLIEGDENYDFTWVGKKNSVIEANTPTTKTLIPCIEESESFDTTENLYIEGDNLEVLKILQKSYFGKIKCIYIDPPYNTGNDFIYNDDFNMDTDEYKDKSGEVDNEGNRLFKNTDSNGRFHSDWCSMMYSRLKLAYNLLSDDGGVFVSIDDNELDNLRKILDDIFGDRNFISIMPRKTVEHVRKLARYELQNINDFVVFYTKNIDKVEIIKDIVGTIEYQYEDKNGKYTLKAFQNSGENGTRSARPNLYYPIFYDLSTKEFSLNKKSKDSIELLPRKIMHEDGRWLWSKEKFESDKDLLEFKNGTIYRKSYYCEENDQNKYQVKKSWIENIPNRLGAKALKECGLDGCFDYSKPVELLVYLISMIVNENDIILDFFSGSSTTAHAVMKLNAEDGGKRKFIMVQLPEETNEDSEAYKAGYKNICEIGKERIRRAGKKILEDNKDREGIKNLDIGFRVLKLSDSNMKDVYYNPDDYSQDLISQLTSNIKDDRNEDDLLFASLLDRGIDISKSYRKVDIDGKKVIIYNEEGEVPEFIACFDENITEKCVTEIAKMKPLKATFRDSSFGSSSDRINVEEIFKLYSKDTRVSVM